MIRLYSAVVALSFDPVSTPPLPVNGKHDAFVLLD